MPFNGTRQHLLDIVRGIDLIETFIAELDFEEYCADLKTKAAVERMILQVAEAAFRLGPDAQQLIPNHDWRGLRGMSNQIRHAYDGLENPILWEAVKVDLPQLRTAVRALLKKLQST